MVDASRNIGHIWEKFREGDVEAFAHLYNLHVDMLFRYGTKLCSDDDLVKDAIHEVFLDLYQKRQNNRSNPDNLRYYLMLAIKRNLIKKLKSSRRWVPGETGTDFFQAEYFIENSLEGREAELELNRKITLMLRNLTPKQKEVLYLRYNESMPYDEIATVLNITVESARKQVYRALASIREQFGKNALLLFLIQSRL